MFRYVTFHLLYELWVYLWIYQEISFYLTMIPPLFKNRTVRGAEEKESEMLRHTKMLLLGGSGENWPHHLGFLERSYKKVGEVFDYSERDR